MKNTIFILAAALIMGACSSGNDTQNLTIASQKAIGYGVGPMECLLVKENPNADWELFYNNIERFDYEPGYEYEVRVRVQQIDNPPADASSLRYTLDRVVSKERKRSDGIDGFSLIE